MLDSNSTNVSMFIFEKGNDKEYFFKWLFMSEMYTENVLEALHPLIYVDFFTWWEFIICILSWGRSIINENFQSYGQKIQSLAKNNTVFKFAFAFTVCLWGEEMWGGRFCVCPTSPHPLDAGLRNLYDQTAGLT